MKYVAPAREVRPGWTIRFGDRHEKVTSNQRGPRGFRKIRTDHCDHNVPANRAVTVISQPR